MPFDISTFRARMLNDGARPSLFEVYVPIPVNIFAGVANVPVLGDLTFKARASSLPGDSLSNISIPYFGREIKVAGTRTFPSWTVTCINDENFAVRNSFERWMNSINSHAGNLRNPVFNPPTSYQTNATVIQYGKSGQIIKTYELVGCFPTDVSPIDLDWGNGDSIEEFTITFEYQWWQSPSSYRLGENAAAPSNFPTTT